MSYRITVVDHRTGAMRVLEVWHACRGGELRKVLSEAAGRDEKATRLATEAIIQAGLVTCPECGEKIG